MYGLVLADETHYRINREENLFFIRCKGHWDREVAEDFATKFRWLIEVSKIYTWGMVADLREWEGATAEGIVIARDTLQWMIDNGLVAGAHVLGSGVMSESLKTLELIQREQIVFDTFLSFEIAVPWLRAKVKQQVSALRVC